MSHGIKERDRLAYVGEIPWHGLGTNLGPDLVGGDAILDAAELRWTVSVRPSFFPTQLMPPSDYDVGERFAFPIIEPAWVRGHRNVLVRDDTLTPLGNVGSRFTTLQNERCVAFLDGLMEASGDSIRYEVAGSLDNGGRVWFVARLGEDFQVQRLDGSVDEYMKYLLFINHHDGEGSAKCLCTPIRGVCNNTITWAVNQAEWRNDPIYRFRHVENIEDRLDECAEALRLSVSYYGELAAVLEDIEQERFTAEKTRDFAASVMTDVKGTFDEVMATLKERGRTDHAIERVADAADVCSVLFTEGAGNHGETKGDALQGTIEFIDHHRKRKARAASFQAKQAKRFDDLVFGDGMRRKSRALELIREW
jgi:phage/plasmid-like protein (TIGR03299 family)